MLSMKIRNFIVVCLLCICGIICVESSINGVNKELMDEYPKILLTCTTYLSKQYKMESLKQTLDSILKYTPIDVFARRLVINEYDENVTASTLSLQKMYPKFEFIQKSKENKGQARSINIIIDLLREEKYVYWLHWEDSWILKAPFLSKALDIMMDDRVDQLQLIRRWEDTPKTRQQMWTTKSGVEYIEILKLGNSIDVQLKPFGTCSYFDLNWKRNIKHWPLFSLSPGIDKVDTILKTGYFNESDILWPITFEFQWSVKWICNGARKAVLMEVVSERFSKHVSTYKTQVVSGLETNSKILDTFKMNPNGSFIPRQSQNQFIGPV